MSRVVAYCPPGRKVTSGIVLVVRGEHFDELRDSAILAESGDIFVCSMPDEPIELPPLRLTDWTPLDEWRVASRIRCRNRSCLEAHP